MAGGFEQAVRNMVARGVLVMVNATSKLQSLQIRLTAKETKGGLEHAEPYGFSSNPHPGAEAFAVFLQGDRSHGVVLCVADRRYRIQGLKSGEIALYTDEGDQLVFKRDNIVELTTKTFRVQASEMIDLISPVVNVEKNLNVGDTVRAEREVFAGSVASSRHEHAGVMRGDDTSGRPVS